MQDCKALAPSPGPKPPKDLGKPGVRGTVRAGCHSMRMMRRALQSSGGAAIYGGQRISAPVSTYGEIPPGGLGALVGSSGLVEISAREASAAEQLGAGRGTPVEVLLVAPEGSGG